MVGRTSCGSAAHERTRVIVMSEPDGMAQLVGHDVTTDVGEVVRTEVSVTNRDEPFANV